MKNKIVKQVLVWAMAFVSLLLIVRSFSSLTVEQEIDYSSFKRNLRDGKIVEVSVRPDLIRGKMKVADGREVNFKTIPLVDSKLVEELEIYKVQKYSGETERTWWPMIFQNFFFSQFFSQ